MAKIAKEKKPRQNAPSHKDKNMIDTIKDRQTEELVIAICGPIGSGTSTITKKLEKIFSDFDYQGIKKIKISELIERHIDTVKTELENDEYLKDSYAATIDLNKNINEIDKADRIALLQSAGNALRKKFSVDVLAQLAIKEIAVKRKADESEKEGDERISRRYVTIIDSLKNPKEAELLQMVYRDMFYLFGVLCPEDIRQNRLIDQKKINPTKAVQLMMRDKSEGEKHGQQLLKTIYHSDFFVTNSKENVDSLEPNLNRYVRIIMGDKSITPTKEENAMFHAQSAAVKSGCLSKQVGAAIIDDQGNLLSTGCNDVPKAGGGLYSAEDKDDDSRCMFKYGNKCKNQEWKDDIFNDLDKILSANIKTNLALRKKISDEIRKHNRLKNLIEFCRAIHAEMDAITSAARNGKVPLKGASLFSTTFPCHNCARHIIATGISKVYYIEPYEKSLALNLHNDAISFNGDNSGITNKVEFIPFEGVSPRKYLRLFQAEERKLDGARANYNQRTASPAIIVLLETRYEYESKVVEHLDRIGLQG